MHTYVELNPGLERARQAVEALFPATGSSSGEYLYAAAKFQGAIVLGMFLAAGDDALALLTWAKDTCTDLARENAQFEF